MEKINELLGKLDNRVTANIAKRLDGLKKLNEKVALAEQEHLEKPTSESEESLKDIKQYVSEITDDLTEDLEDLIESKKNQLAEKQAKEKEAKEKGAKELEAKEVQAKEVQAKEVQAKEVELQQKPPVVEEKKKGFGIFGIITGVALLVASVGVINVMKNNR
jgi:hypothetical protein